MVNLHWNSVLTLNWNSVLTLNWNWVVKITGICNTNTLNRILEVQQLPDDVKEKLFYFIDMTVRDYKAKKAFS